MIDKIILKISSNEDVEKFLSGIEDNTKINHFHLEIIGHKPDIKDMYPIKDKLFFITDENFLKMWQKIKHLDLYNRIHLDISNLAQIDEKWIDIISESLQTFNPREINFNFSELTLSDEQFDKILKNSLSHMNNLEKLHLIMENVKISQNKMESIEEILKTLSKKKLSHVYINLKRNEIKDSKLINLNEILKDIFNKEIDIY